MRKFALSSLPVLIYLAIFWVRVRNSGGFVRIDRDCQVFQDFTQNNYITFVCPDPKWVKKPSNSPSEDEELLVKFKRYYVYDEGDRLVQSVTLSSALGPSKRVSVCKKARGANCLQYELILARPFRPSEPKVDLKSGSSLVKQMEITGNKIVNTHYNPDTNVFQVFLDPNSADEDLFLSLNDPSLLYFLNGVGVKTPKMTSLKSLSRGDGRVQGHYLLVGHNKESDRRSFVLIKVTTASTTMPSSNTTTSNSTTTNSSSSNEDGIVVSFKFYPLTGTTTAGEDVVIGAGQELERVISTDSEVTLITVKNYYYSTTNGNSVVKLDGVLLRASDYQLLLVQSHQFTLQIGNRRHKITLNSSSTSSRLLILVKLLLLLLILVTVANGLVNGPRMYLDSLTFVLFPLIHLDKLVPLKDFRVINRLLISITTSTNSSSSSGSSTDGGEIVGEIVKFLAHHLINGVLLAIIIAIIVMAALGSSSKSGKGSNNTGKGTNSSPITARNSANYGTLFKKYKWHVLSLLTHLSVAQYLTTPRMDYYFYFMGLKMKSLHWRLVSQGVLIVSIALIFRLYPRIRMGQQISRGLFGIIYDSSSTNNSNRSGSRGGFGTLSRNESNVSILQIRATEDPLKGSTESKTLKGVKNRYRLLYINAILVESVLLVTHKLLFKGVEKTFLLKSVVWLALSVFIRKRNDEFSEDAINKYLFFKGLKCLGLWVILLLQGHLKSNLWAVVILTVLNHCIDHRLWVRARKMAKRARMCGAQRAAPNFTRNS